MTAACSCCVSATASLSFPSRDGYIPLGGGVVCVDVRGGDGVVYRRGGRLFVASLSLSGSAVSLGNKAVQKSYLTRIHAYIALSSEGV